MATNGKQWYDRKARKVAIVRTSFPALQQVTLKLATGMRNASKNASLETLAVIINHLVLQLAASNFAGLKQMSFQVCAFSFYMK